MNIIKHDFGSKNHKIDSIFISEHQVKSLESFCLNVNYHSSNNDEFKNLYSIYDGYSFNSANEMIYGIMKLVKVGSIDLFDGIKGIKIISRDIQKRENIYYNEKQFVKILYQYINS